MACSSASAPSSDGASSDPADALLAQAARLAAAGQPLAAIEPLRGALRHRPSHAGLQHDLGYLCLQAGQPQEAADAFRAALQNAPGFALAAMRLGIALQATGDLPGALAAWEDAVRLQPTLAEARFRHGDLLETLGRREAAAASFRAASTLRPETSLTRLCHARALLAEERDAEAESVLRHLLRLDPSNALAMDLLGLVLTEAGRLAEARDCFECATRAAPHLAGSYYELVRCRPLAAGDGDLVSRMRAAFEEPTLSDGARLKLHLAFGQALDDLGEPAAAMAEFDRAARLRTRLGGFDIVSFEQRAARLAAGFTRELLADAATPQDGPAPILIVGLPRSGTTLVEQILACHTQVAAGGELAFWTERGASLEQSGLPMPPGQEFLRTSAADYCHLLARIARQVSLSAPAAFVTDKMPLNIFWVGLIHLALPRARFVLCKRSLIDTALSIHRTYFNPHAAFPTGGNELVRAIRAVERLCAHWRRALPPGRFIEIEYEALATQPERQIRMLLESCRLSWEPACLHPERNGRVVRTPSKWQVRRPISTGAVGRWQRYRPWLGPLSALLLDE